MPDTESETVAVTVTVRSVERQPGKGRLRALAVVEIEAAGVALAIHGVRVIRKLGGGLECAAPCFRSESGAWGPAIELPRELAAAVAEAVLESYAAASGKWGASAGADA